MNTSPKLVVLKKTPCAADEVFTYLVVLAKQIENCAADGSNYDYSLENEESSCWSDLSAELERKYPGLRFLLVGDNEVWIDFYNSEDKAFDKAQENDTINEIREFAKKWLKEHEKLDNATLYWNVWDGSSWTSTPVRHSEDCEDDFNGYMLLSDDSDEATNVLKAYHNTSKLTKDFSQHHFVRIIDTETYIEVGFTNLMGAGYLAFVD